MAGTTTSEKVLSFEAASSVVEHEASTLAAPLIELVNLLDSAGRILAQDVFADRNLPPFPRAARDGYAVRSSDLSEIPSRLRVIGEVRAGSDARFALSPGDAVEIMTGAPVPSGADAVVMLEYASRVGTQVEVWRAAGKGENIVPAGSEARKGDVLLDPGTRLAPAAVAVAASTGVSEIRVFARPRIAILATGDELVDVATNPGPAQIRNSNSYSLAAQVKAAGAIPIVLPIAPDELSPLRKLVEEGLRSDLLLLAGGVSVGKHDLVERVLADLGAEFFFTGALIQPGKPVVFGRIPQRETGNTVCFFGLPGNPVSTLVTFELFARPVIEALGGAKAQQLVFPKAKLKQEVRRKPGLTRFLPAVLGGRPEDAEVELAPWQGSGDMVSTARANCFLVYPADREMLLAGEMVPVMLA